MKEIFFGLLDISDIRSSSVLEFWAKLSFSHTPWNIFRSEMSLAMYLQFIEWGQFKDHYYRGKGEIATFGVNNSSMYIQPGAWCFPVSHYWSFLYSILPLCSRILIRVPDKKIIFFFQIVAFLWILLLEVHLCQWWSMMMKLSSTFFI